MQHQTLTQHKSNTLRCTLDAASKTHQAQYTHARHKTQTKLLRRTLLMEILAPASSLVFLPRLGDTRQSPSKKQEPKQTTAHESCNIPSWIRLVPAKKGWASKVNPPKGFKLSFEYRDNACHPTSTRALSKTSHSAFVLYGFTPRALLFGLFQ